MEPVVIGKVDKLDTGSSSFEGLYDFVLRFKYLIYSGAVEMAHVTWLNTSFIKFKCSLFFLFR